MPKTDISIIADIRTEGRTKQQIDAQLRQKINGFHKKVSRLGHNLKKVDVFENDAGKCVIVIDSVEAEEILEAGKVFGGLWKQVAWPEAGQALNSNASFELLVEELVDIACSTYRHNGGPSHFWLPVEGDGRKESPCH